MNSWTSDKLGYRGENKGPRSILYCAPEEFVDEEHPYAFDMYSAAITWIRMALSDDGHDEELADDEDVNDDDAARSSRGLGNENELFKWRMDVRNFGHDLVAWEEYATLHDSLPHGWDDLFGSSRLGIQALRLLSNMMSYSPEFRMSAAEALVGPYLNPGCDAGPPPELPPAMPYSITSHIQRWKKDREVHGECRLEDLFTTVVAVEIDWPLSGLSFGPVNETAKRSERKAGGGGGGGGVRVNSIVSDVGESSSLSRQLGGLLREGDRLLAIGSIDVEDASVDHVMDLLDQWPPRKPVAILVVRDA
ncbi:hypothetical protein ACHAXA_001320 [Cyclostephanos tholiformis]|uniref:PDZ domain-containing protein n=1 Tax=Cyclostephanos tholiformis TaxID=382380 RepID=A0ABD3RG99_9STRA